MGCVEFVERRMLLRLQGGAGEKEEEVVHEEIVIRFDLDNERDKRILSGIKRIPAYMEEDDFSEAFIGFMEVLFQTLIECEDKKNECENMLNHFMGKTARH